jgi:hypothetical protein
MIFIALRKTLAPKLKSVSQTMVWYWSASLCIVLAAMCASMPAYGSTRPVVNGALRLGLNRCIDGPCFQAMVPGRISWKDAVITLEALYDRGILEYSNMARGALSYVVTDSRLNRELVLHASPDSRTLTSIYIRPPLAQPVTVGDILGLYGAPACIDTFYRTSGNLTLHYDSLHVLVPIDGKRFNSATRIISILLDIPGGHSQDRCDTNQPGNPGAPDTPPWRGFALLQHYLSLE